MVTVRKSKDRGHANHGWLDTCHSFSFANYYDPRFTGFRDLLVINEDRVTPGEGFGMHPHRDMEIISYILSGSLEHKDSLGSGSVIPEGCVQRISAGTGVRHSEFNPSATEMVHFLQIWISPKVSGLKPSYEQKALTLGEKSNRLKLIASSDGHDDSLVIHQDASVYASVLSPGVEIVHSLAPGRHAWIQVVRGTLDLNGLKLEAGDGVAMSELSKLRMTAREMSEFLVFDLA